MKYMLLIYSPENAWTPDEWKQCVETSRGICQEMAAKGQFMAASPPSIRVRESERWKFGRSSICRRYSKMP